MQKFKIRNLKICQFFKIRNPQKCHFFKKIESQVICVGNNIGNITPKLCCRSIQIEYLCSVRLFLVFLFLLQKLFNCHVFWFRNFIDQILLYIVFTEWMTMQYIERINPSKCRNVALGGCITTGFDFFSLEKKMK